MKELDCQPIVLSKQEKFAMVDAAPNLKIKAAVALFYTSVSFLWKDYTDDSKQKVMTVDTV